MADRAASLITDQLVMFWENLGCNKVFIKWHKFSCACQCHFVDLQSALSCLFSALSELGSIWNVGAALSGCYWVGCRVLCLQNGVSGGAIVIPHGSRACSWLLFLKWAQFWVESVVHEYPTWTERGIIKSYCLMTWLCFHGHLLYSYRNLFTCAFGCLGSLLFFYLDFCVE